MASTATQNTSQRDGVESIERPAREEFVPMTWGSDAIAEVLRRLGIEFIALVPGASYRCLHDSLVNYLGNERPQMLMVLHEEHAVAIAHGYAKVTEQPMAVALHSNVGLMHATMAIFNAWCDRLPLLLLGATGPVDARRRRPWIDWIHTAADQAALVRNFIKWDDQPVSPEAGVEAVVRAWQVARRPPQGPTYVCLPVELQEQEITDGFALPEVARYQSSQRIHSGADVVAAAAALLRRAERPVVMAGRVSRSRQAWDQRVRLAEALNARVLTDSKVAAAFPTSHRLHHAQLALSADSAELLRTADVILSLNWLDLAGTLRSVFGSAHPTAKIIHVSVDALSHHGWSMDYMGLAPVDIEILAEPDTILRPLLAALGAEANRESERSESAVAADGVALKRLASAGSAEQASGLSVTGGSRNLQELDLGDLADCLGSTLGNLRISLIRTPLGWPADRYDIRGPLDYLGYDGGAGIGSGPGTAVGAALALRNSGYLPVAVLGDGDYLMGVTALWTAVRYRIPLLVIVANNRSYFNDEVHQQTVARLRGRPTENKWIGQKIVDPHVDLAAMARAQGAQGIGPVTGPYELEAALKTAIESVVNGNVCVIDAVVKAA